MGFPGSLATGAAVMNMYVLLAALFDNCKMNWSQADASGETKSIGLKDLELHLRQSGESDSVINAQLEILDVGLWAQLPPLDSPMLNSTPEVALPIELETSESAGTGH